jgi:hypothetical protein
MPSSTRSAAWYPAARFAAATASVVPAMSMIGFGAGIIKTGEHRVLEKILVFNKITQNIIQTR